MNKKTDLEIKNIVTEWVKGNDSYLYKINKIDKINKKIYFEYIDYFGEKQKMVLGY